MAKPKRQRLYLIPILSKTFDIMELLQAEKAPMSLETIYNRTRISKASVYRIMHTLVHRGYATRGEDGLYRHAGTPKKLRFGFGNQSVDMPFSEEVKASLQRAAASAGVDLMVLDNHYDAKTALKNADEFVKAGVDLVIEFQIDQHIAPLIADRIAGAGVPLIAVDIPHPHATYFGVDNFRVGLDSGICLASAAKREWDGAVEWVLGLDIEEAGPLVQSRITGCFEGIRSVLPAIPQQSFVRIDSRGLRDKCRRITGDFLNRHPHSKRILVASSTDSGALGALEAAREANRTADILIVGHDCIPEMIEELEDPESPIVGSISSEVSAYGPQLMELAISLLQGKNVPPYNYVQHRLVSRSAQKDTQRTKKRVTSPVPVAQKRQAGGRQSVGNGRGHA